MKCSPRARIYVKSLKLCRSLQYSGSAYTSFGCLQTQVFGWSVKLLQSFTLQANSVELCLAPQEGSRQSLNERSEFRDTQSSTTKPYVHMLKRFCRESLRWRPRRESNPRPFPQKGTALSSELLGPELGCQYPPDSQNYNVVKRENQKLPTEVFIYFPLNV